MDLEKFKPQAEKELAGWRSSAQTAAESKIKGYQGQRAQIDPYYSTLMNELGQQKETAGKALTASMIRRGAGRSGVMTRAESNLAGTYAGLGQKLEGEKRTKIGEVESALTTAQQERANVDVEYQSKVDQLARELYSAWKTAEDQRIYNEQQLAIARSQGGGYGTTGADEKLTRDDYDAELSTLEDRLRGFQASGYNRDYLSQNKLSSLNTMIAGLKRDYRGVVSEKEINSYLPKLYSRYKINTI